MLYKYKAISENGESIEGIFQANSELEVLMMIRNNRWLPISIKENVDIGLKIPRFLSKVKRSDLVIFCRQFHTMVDGGIEILECLEILALQTKNKVLKRIFKSMSEDIQKGYTISKAMDRHREVFPPILINMVEVGEMSGNLDTVLKRMTIYFEKENKLENKIKSSLIYPTILMGISILVLTFILVVVFPIFIEIFEYNGIILPWPTRLLLKIGTSFISYWRILSMILTIMIFSTMYYRQTYSGRKFIDRFKIRVPIIRIIYIKVITSRFTRTFSILISSGIPLLQSLEIVGKALNNVYAQDKLIKAEEHIRKGYSLSKVVEDMRLFPAMVHSMIRVGEVSGSLDNMLHKTADFYDTELEIDFQRLTTLVEPVLLILMSIFIGFIVLAMVLPIFNMVDII